MRRYLRLLRIFLANAVQLELEYRINLVMNAANAALSLAAGMVVLLVMFGQVESLGGWSFMEAVTLFGVFMVFEALIDLFLYPNLGKLPELIRKGGMDFLLLKPVAGPFLVSFRHANLWQVPDLFIGAALLLYGMGELGTLTAANLLLAAALIGSGAVILYSIWFMLCTTAFWWVKTDNIPELFNAWFGAGRFPVTAFPSWARLLLTVVIPIAFITTVPASAAIGRLDWRMALGSAAMAAVFLVLSQLLWRRAVAGYTSASS